MSSKFSDYLQKNLNSRFFVDRIYHLVMFFYIFEMSITILFSLGTKVILMAKHCLCQKQIIWKMILLSGLNCEIEFHNLSKWANLWTIYKIMIRMVKHIILESSAHNNYQWNQKFSWSLGIINQKWLKFNHEILFLCFLNGPAL
jgi:hypothetical protein